MHIIEHKSIGIGQIEKYEAKEGAKRPQKQFTVFKGTLMSAVMH